MTAGFWVRRCGAWWRGSLWKTPELRARVMPGFVTFTLLTVAGPLLWFWYNQHFAHDWLDFLRGPYSAKAIERKTSPPGSALYADGTIRRGR